MSGSPLDAFEALTAAAAMAVAEPFQGFAEGSAFLAVPASAAEAEVLVEKLIFRLLEAAVLKRASDLHIEPTEVALCVRYRVDGVLQKGSVLPATWQGPFITRLKLMGGMDLGERRLPQDGRFSTQCAGRGVDIRLATLPTAYGETMTLRFLEQKRACLELKELGFSPEDLLTFTRLLEKPDGLVVVAGPTGAGKSTTLYAALKYLSRSDRKIITVEDPVEAVLPGVSQVAVRPEVGLTFVQALRAILRQAPNILMVGEVRDPETAEMVLHAALTGHLVLTTVHTYDTTAAIARFLDLGIKPSLLAGALRGVLAQRLVRRVCMQCENVQAAKVACLRCQGVGYRGRMGLFELLSLTPPIEQAVCAMKSSHIVRMSALEAGMISLRVDGLKKVEAGWVDLAEVMMETASNNFDK